MVALHCDGSLSADRAAYGGIIRHATGDPILAYVGKGVETLVLCMELLAIHRGVALCLERDLQSVSIRSDSKLAVDIITGAVSCPWSVYVLKCQISSLLTQLTHLEVRHVWRELNQPADFVASIDSGDGETIIYPPNFPEDLMRLIHDDTNRKTYFRIP
ncbi:uncharacterized protein LOC122647943 [Telopea speciosissima]|uniref:uncharacterized protein LOC122647943 n=1 Tax=Telopea speciosissima TaxID=54955 RepID=UPI001CC4AC5C|nr:uncharacterized protein LOC122647943 [Telopea speciosissima]